VKSNVGGTFIKLLAKHFPQGHKLHKIFNRNTVKISYSCMKNMRAIVKSDNSKIIKKSNQELPKRTCNCRVKGDCPLLGKCLSSAIVYKATVKSVSEPSKSYIGLTGGTFKERYSNHKKSFKHEKYEKETELSKYVWGLKRMKTDFAIDWEIIRKSNTKRRKSGQCNLCLDEKLEILHHKDHDVINKRTELISKCRHDKRPVSRVKKK
jgi:predicted GIY-YIG superfamily endonuclease